MSKNRIPAVIFRRSVVTGGFALLCVVTGMLGAGRSIDMRCILELL